MREFDSELRARILSSSELDQSERDQLGVDTKDRLHGAAALALLLGQAHESAKQQDNLWKQADAAVSATKNTEVKDAALAYLLSLHLHHLEDDLPQVAMRNVRVGDIVMLHGVALAVEKIINPYKPCITLQTRLGAFAYDRDVRIPLFSRDGPPK